MSTTTPRPNSGYASPALIPLTKPNPPKTKPTNVFSNDGSFLERFQLSKKEEEGMKKQEETLAMKREFDCRFKQRGKRTLPDPSPAVISENPPAKKVKSDASLTDYQKQVNNYTPTHNKERGTGVRPFIK